MCWRNFRDMTVATFFLILLTSKALFWLMSFLKSFVPSMRWNFWSLQQDCRAKIREKTLSNHYLSSRKTVEFSFSFLPPPTIYGYRSVIIIEVEIWISVRIKKSVIWGLSTFKLKSKYTVIFVDFVVCGFTKTCHVACTVWTQLKQVGSHDDSPLQKGSDKCFAIKKV